VKLVVSFWTAAEAANGFWLWFTLSIFVTDSIQRPPASRSKQKFSSFFGAPPELESLINHKEPKERRETNLDGDFLRVPFGFGSGTLTPVF